MGALLLSSVTLDAQDLDQKWEWNLKQVGENDYVPLEKFREFYAFGDPKRNGGEIHLETGSERKNRIVVNFKVGSKECHFNKTKIILNREIMEDGGEVFLSREDLSRVIDPILRPDRIGGVEPVRFVILDAAGGGDPAGDAARHAQEIAEKARPMLEARGFQVVMTTTGDKTMTVEERVGVANRIQEPAVFVSINLLDQKDGTMGIGTSVLVPHDVEGREDVGEIARLGAALGISIHGTVGRLGEEVRDNGLSFEKESGFSGLRHPAIALTVANLVDENQAKLAANEKFPNAVAYGIDRGITKYRSGIGKKRD
jgi:N-acetylmuramoyl-L-alanine amidase